MSIFVASPRDDGAVGFQRATGIPAGVHAVAIAVAFAAKNLTAFVALSRALVSAGTIATRSCFTAPATLAY